MTDTTWMFLTIGTTFLAAVAPDKLNEFDLAILARSQSPLVRQLLLTVGSDRREIGREIAAIYFARRIPENERQPPGPTRPVYKPGR